MTEYHPPQPEGPPGAGAADTGPAAETPPLTAFAWRNGLVRPTRGRLLAGVSGALARATNTDPVLWRVIIAVLTIFGALGVLVYALGWLLLPADGDTASPIEALLGRGRSATSNTLTVIVALVALVTVGTFVSEPFRPGILGAVLLGLAALLLLRDRSGKGRPQPMPPNAYGPTPGAPTADPGAAAGPATAFGPTGAAAPTPATAPAAPGPVPGPAPYPYPAYSPTDPHPGTPTGPGTATLPAAEAGTYPAPAMGPVSGGGSTVTAEIPTPPPTVAYNPPRPYPAYTPLPPLPPQPPFAPRGPFAPAGRPPQPPAPPRPPRPRPPRSRLPRLTFSLLLIVVGGLIAIDLGYHRIPTSAYVAAALATVALGLIVGSWFGRARGLIAVGILLTLVLGLISTFDNYDRGWHGGSVTYTPPNANQLEAEYRQDVGDLRLDLTNVDFASQTRPVDVDVSVDVGSIRITVPPNVDVVVDADLDVGNAQVFGQTWGGLGLDPRTVSDNGADGPGGGTLHLTSRIGAGNLEVSR